MENCEEVLRVGIRHGRRDGQLHADCRIKTNFPLFAEISWCFQEALGDSNLQIASLFLLEVSD